MTERYNLRKRRIGLGLSQAQLCEIAGLSRPHYAEVEAGKKPLTEKMRTKIDMAFENVERSKDKNGQAVVARDIAATGDASPVIIQSPGATNNARVSKACPATEPHWASDLRTKLDALAADHAIIKDLLLKLAAK